MSVTFVGKDLNKSVNHSKSTMPVTLSSDTKNIKANFLCDLIRKKRREVDVPAAYG